MRDPNVSRESEDDAFARFCLAMAVINLVAAAVLTLAGLWVLAR